MLNEWKIRSTVLQYSACSWIVGVAASSAISAQDIEKRLTLESESTMVWADFSSDGRRIATANGSSTDGVAARLQVWDAESGQVLKVLQGHSLAVTRGDFHPKDPNLLATVGWDGQAIRWNLDSGRPVWKKQVADTKVANVAFSHDGTVLAVATATGVIKLLNPDNGDLIREIMPHGQHTANGLAFFNDGKRMVTAGVDRTVKVTGLIADQQDHQWNIETPYAFDVAVSHDGRRVAAPSRFQGITVWDVTTGEQERDFSVEGPFAFSVAFSPDGNWLAAGSGEPGEHGEIKIWDVECGEVIHTTTAHSGAAMFVRFDPQGRQLISASEDGSAIVWRVAATKPSTPTPTQTQLDFPLAALIDKAPDSPEVRKLTASLPQPTAVEFSDSSYWSWKNHGLSLRFDTAGNTTTIFLYAEGVDDFRQYQGELPHGLKFGMTRAEVELALGEPKSVVGGDGLTVGTNYSDGLLIHYQTTQLDDKQAKIGTVVVSKS